MNTKLLNTTLLITLLTSSSLLAKEGSLFTEVTLGYTHLNVKHENKIGSITLGNEIQERGYNYALLVGYNYSDTIAITTSYQRVEHDDTHQNNFLLGLEYTLKKMDALTPYVGTHIGYSQLHWDKKPINTTNNDYVSGSWLVGAKAGVSYRLDTNVDVRLEYLLQVTDHTTHIVSTPARSELTHNISNSIHFGIRYSF